jgi:predicted enzyme related to lactoylglutathione lyase
MQIKPLFLSAALGLAMIATAAFATTLVDARAATPTPAVAVGPQYDTTHVYVAPEDVDRFAQSFLATFGGQSTRQVVTTVTPTSSSTTAQLLQTPVGTVSLFGFKTPVPYPFGSERNGYLVTDMDVAIKAARQAGADVLVSTFLDPVGRDAVIQWPGGVNMQLYWHTIKPSYAALRTVPENRVYVSPDGEAAFIRGFLAFSHGKVVSDNAHAAGLEIGRPADSYRRIRIYSIFGRMTVFVTDGHLPYPYGRETTGYEVADLQNTLSEAKAAGVTVIVEPYASDGRVSAVVRFPGGYVAEIHGPAHAAAEGAGSLRSHQSRRSLC